MVKIYEILEGMEIEQDDLVYDMFKCADIFDEVCELYKNLLEDTSDFTGEPEQYYFPYEIPTKVMKLRQVRDMVSSVYPTNKVLTNLCNYMINYLENGIS